MRLLELTIFPVITVAVSWEEQFIVINVSKNKLVILNFIKTN